MAEMHIRQRKFKGKTSEKVFSKLLEVLTYLFQTQVN
jgi:hypothetical protein